MSPRGSAGAIARIRNPYNSELLSLDARRAAASSPTQNLDCLSEVIDRRKAQAGWRCGFLGRGQRRDPRTRVSQSVLLPADCALHKTASLSVEWRRAHEKQIARTPGNVGKDSISWIQRRAAARLWSSPGEVRPGTNISGNRVNQMG